MKATLLTLLAFGMFSAVTVIAEDACCVGHSSQMTKEACSATFASLDLTAAQKAKMEKLSAECMKGGCNEATMTKMEKGARQVLTKERSPRGKHAAARCPSTHIAKADQT